MDGSRRIATMHALCASTGAKTACRATHLVVHLAVVLGIVCAVLGVGWGLSTGVWGNRGKSVGGMGGGVRNWQ